MTRLAKVLGGIIILLSAIGTVVLALQGWGGRITSFDLVPHAMEAWDLLAHGTIPSHGCLSSFGSYIPPGTSWLMVPGQLMFSDPRLEIIPSALILHFLSALGVYLLAKWCVNKTAGMFAVVIFCAAPATLGVAASLWPRFPMAATVWFTYFVARWACDRKPGYLGAALVVLMLGIYIHMEGLILVAGLPLVWVVTRPPIWGRYLLLALVLSFIVWFPYFKFEAGRNFIDMKSQLARHSLFYETGMLAQVEDMARTCGLPYNQYKLPVATPENKKLSRSAKVLESADSLAIGVVSSIWNMGSNFAGYGWGAGLCIGLGAIILAFALVQMLPFIRNLDQWSVVSRIRTWHAYPFPKRLLDLMGVGMLLAACLVNEWLVSHILSSDGHLESYTIRPIRLFQGLLAFGGVVLLALKPGMKTLRKWAEKPVSRLGFLAIIIIPPWLLMMSLASMDQPYRFWFLWPLQVVMGVGILKALLFAGEVSVAPEYCLWRKRMAMITVGVALMAMVANPAVISRVKEWREQGWKGSSEEVRALDGFGRDLAKVRERAVAVGYVVPYQPFMANFHVLNPVYKIGLHYDWYLWRSLEIRNINISPSGTTDHDCFRFVVSRTPLETEQPALIVSFDGWDKLGEAGCCSWWRQSQQ